MLPPSSGTKPGSPAWREAAGRRKRQAPAWNLLGKPASEPQPALPEVIGEPRPTVGRVSPGQSAVKRFQRPLPWSASCSSVSPWGPSDGGPPRPRAPPRRRRSGRTFLHPTVSMARRQWSERWGRIVPYPGHGRQSCQIGLGPRTSCPRQARTPIGLLSGGPSIPAVPVGVRRRRRSRTVSSSGGRTSGRFDIGALPCAAPIAAGGLRPRAGAVGDAIPASIRNSFSAALEFRSGLVTALPAGWTEDDVLADIEDTSLTMATAFYEHLQTWGDRRPALDGAVDGPPDLRPAGRHGGPARQR